MRNWQAGETFHLPGLPRGPQKWGTGGLTKTEGWDLHVSGLAGTGKRRTLDDSQRDQGIKRDQGGWSQEVPVE